MQSGQKNEQVPDSKKTGHMRGARFFFHCIAVMAILVVLLPVALYPFTPAFTGKTLAVSLFIVVCLERMWAMYLRQGLGRTCAGAGRDWTAIAVGYAYVLTLGVAIAEFLLWRHFPGFWPTATGAAVYGTGVALRYWAFHALRHQWHVDVSNTGGSRHRVR